MRNTLLVEFVGLSASGKTTLAKAVCAELDAYGLHYSFRGNLVPRGDEGQKISGKAKNKLKELRFFFLPPLALWESRSTIWLVLRTYLNESKGQRRIPPVSPRKIPNTRLALKSIIRNNYRRRKSVELGSVAVLDEGCFHETWWYWLRLAESTTEADLFQLVLGKYKTSTLFVFVFSDPGVVFERLLARKRTPNTVHWTTDRASIGLYQNYLDSSFLAASKLSETHLHLIVRRVQDLASQEVEVIAAEIAQQIRRIARPEGTS